MSRARLLKPGFFANETLAELHPYGRLLFAGLWTLADREGRLVDIPKRIQGALFPYENQVPVDALLSDLQDHGFIYRYTVKSDRYIQIINFEKHQSPHIKEVASTIPAPCSPDASTNFSGASPSVPIPVSDPVPIAVTVPVAEVATLRLPLAKVFNNLTGRLITPMEAEHLRALEEEHPYDRIVYAIEQASLNGVRKIAYIKSVCESQAESGDNHERPTRGTNGVQTSDGLTTAERAWVARTVPERKLVLD